MKIDTLPKLATGRLAGTIPAWMERRDVADYLQISLRTLDRETKPGRKLGLIAKRKFGGKTMFKTASVVAFASDYMEQ